MNILVCIDDTDNIESRGTGELAETLTEVIKENGWGTCSGITRHQLFVHPDIPYTSHNSSMCFKADIKDSRLDEVIVCASEFLVKESAQGSDPGLCVADLSQLQRPELLIDFGKRAKKEIFTKKEAYDLARKQGVHLSEHGGTGQGIIGALAGVGLRLTGNDGRFKGKHRIDAENNAATVKEIIAQTSIEEVRSLEGELLAENDRIRLGVKIKSVLINEKSVLLVKYLQGSTNEIRWETCNMKDLRSY